jgi:hypothetical protein
MMVPVIVAMTPMTVSATIVDIFDVALNGLLGVADLWRRACALRREAECGCGSSDGGESDFHSHFSVLLFGWGNTSPRAKVPSLGMLEKRMAEDIADCHATLKSERALYVHAEQSIAIGAHP